MAKFRQYNIQLLPLDTKKTEEVGSIGYQRLFKQLSDSVKATYKKQNVLDKAYALVNDSYIYPFVIHAHDKYAWGTFVKFHKADTVTELYSSENLFVAPPGATAVTNKYLFRFVFNYEHHTLAIEEGNNKLPGPDVFRKALELFLREVALAFDQHVLTINLISDEQSLSNVLQKGNEFGVVNLKLTFPNGIVPDAMRDLRDNNAHSLNLRVGPERGARMPDIPKFAKDLLKGAVRYGSATVTFFRKTSAKADKLKKYVYSTLSNPEFFTLRQKKQETEEQFLERVWRTLKFKSESRKP